MKPIDFAGLSQFWGKRERDRGSPRREKGGLDFEMEEYSGCKEKRELSMKIRLTLPFSWTNSEWQERMNSLSDL